MFQHQSSTPPWGGKISICIAAITFAFLLPVNGNKASAQNQHPFFNQYKQALELTVSSWLYFRDYDGRQLVYFTHLETYRCAIKQVRYSFNTEKLDRTWELDECDPDNPHNIDPVNHLPYLELPLGTAQWGAVQLIYSDGTTSKLARVEAN